MVDHEPIVRKENSPPAPAIPLRPEANRREKGRSADRCPRPDSPSEISREVGEQCSIRRKITPALIDSSLEPLTYLKRIFSEVPFDEEHLVRRPASENHGVRSFSG